MREGNRDFLTLSSGLRCLSHVWTVSASYSVENFCLLTYIILTTIIKLCLLSSAFQRWENQGIEVHTANEEQSWDASFQDAS